MVEAVDISQSTKHFSTRTSVAQCKARYTELIAEGITDKAEEIGMKVNTLKTQLLMISPPNGFNNKSYISIRNQKINSTEEMKLLGFTFGSQPNVTAHIASIKKKFKSRYWSLIHLRDRVFQVKNY